MKRVSFNVAKAIKEAGYLQEKTDYYYDYNECIQKRCNCYVNCKCVTPTYLEVWLWLWREKKICINCNYDKYNLIPMWWCNNEDGINYNTPNFDDPEEAIIGTIEDLVDKNLIK